MKIQVNNQRSNRWHGSLADFGIVPNGVCLYAMHRLHVQYDLCVAIPMVIYGDFPPPPDADEAPHSGGPAGLAERLVWSSADTRES